MGYRLDVYNESKTINYYGTKHYGYSFIDEIEGVQYPSYRYLLKLKKLKGEEYFDYGYKGGFTLTAKQFRKFIELYAKEWEEIQTQYRDWPETRKLLEEPEMKKLLEDNGKKIICWC